MIWFLGLKASVLLLCLFVQTLETKTGYAIDKFFLLLEWKLQEETV